MEWDGVEWSGVEYTRAGSVGWWVFEVGMELVGL
jgi:hypothetical protein